jgi:nucleotide-binding universal stress UspA family protein
VSWWQISENQLKEDKMKILVGYDESKVAEEALNLALKHAKAFGAEVIIVTSLEQSPSLKKEDIDRTESKLEKLRKPFTANGISCDARANVSYQSPGEDLVSFAKENDIDQIIIGVKRRSKVGKLVFGSNAQFVILEAPCPVLAVK